MYVMRDGYRNFTDLTAKTKNNEKPVHQLKPRGVLQTKEQFGQKNFHTIRQKNHITNSFQSKYKTNQAEEMGNRSCGFKGN